MHGANDGGDAPVTGAPPPSRVPRGVPVELLPAAWGCRSTATTLRGLGLRVRILLRILLLIWLHRFPRSPFRAHSPRAIRPCKCDARRRSTREARYRQVPPSWLETPMYRIGPACAAACPSPLAGIDRGPTAAVSIDRQSTAAVSRISPCVSKNVQPAAGRQGMSHPAAGVTPGSSKRPHARWWTAARVILPTPMPSSGSATRPWKTRVRSCTALSAMP